MVQPPPQPAPGGPAPAPFDGRRFAYGVLLGVFGAFLASLVPRAPGVLAAGAAWGGLGYGFVGIAYLAGRPGWLGKRPDGTQSPLAWLVAGPFLAAVWLAWQLRRRLPEAPWNEVAPGLFLGRRCAAHELPPGVDLIVDVTAELPSIGAPRSVLRVLDGCAPEVAELSALVAGLSGHPGRVFVHCLAGHARSATVVSALLLARGHARTPDEAVRQVKQARQGTRIAPAQRARLEAWWAQDRGSRSDVRG